MQINLAFGKVFSIHLECPPCPAHPSMNRGDLFEVMRAFEKYSITYINDTTNIFYFFYHYRFMKHLLIIHKRREKDLYYKRIKCYI